MGSSYKQSMGWDGGGDEDLPGIKIITTRMRIITIGIITAGIKITSTGVITTVFLMRSRLPMNHAGIDQSTTNRFPRRKSGIWNHEIWNSIPNIVKNISSLRVFKSKCKKILLYQATSQYIFVD